LKRFLKFVFIEVDSSESSITNKTTTRRVFTRKSTTVSVPTVNITLNESTTTTKSISTSLDTTKSSELPVEEVNNMTTIEESVITGIPPLPSIKVKISSTKSLHVRNCGERIGDDVPFIALLVHSNPFELKSKKTLSKAVLISERFVISTVSSIYHSEAFWKVTSVRLGDFVTWNRFAVRDKTLMKEIEVDEIFYHQKYDFALISLKEKVTFTEVIRPACLPSSDSYNFKELKSHFCRRMIGQPDVSLKNAVNIYSTKNTTKIFFNFLSFSH
jgi:coagulation factor X